MFVNIGLPTMNIEPCRNTRPGLYNQVRTDKPNRETVEWTDIKCALILFQRKLRREGIWVRLGSL